MTEVITKLVVDLSKPEGDPERVKSIPLTEEELAERETLRVQAELEDSERQQELLRIAELKESAKEKLIAGEPLTEEEASVLIV